MIKYHKRNLAYGKETSKPWRLLNCQGFFSSSSTFPGSVSLFSVLNALTVFHSRQTPF